MLLETSTRKSAEEVDPLGTVEPKKLLDIAIVSCIQVIRDTQNLYAQTLCVSELLCNWTNAGCLKYRKLYMLGDDHFEYDEDRLVLVGRKSGKIFITLEEISKNNFQFIYSDDGIGMDIENTNFSSLGIKLIKMLVEEMDAKMEMIDKNGLTYIINFTIKK